ncbi:MULTISPECIES: hypothetical protein [Kytococcus]|uniref:Uncharacterized protein n=1 Tax=Kytococcus schroeteri TaxID=138300 RepID=A0A2I1PC74_9MICO|nr:MULTISPECIES: hypothetical protein [Kytococcus]OFS14561.1 hypothetical protein HMPREF3099_03955 [Kytococcus sp. HMSC28H12]PKZ42225.1 hypothetical protein CYJ76_04090 [Kytococcus schroeteri]
MSVQDRFKKLLWWLLLLFIVYAIFTSPDRTGDIFRAIGDIIVQAFRSLGDFYNSVLDGN